MNKKSLAVLLLFLVAFPFMGLAYRDDYPPYKFGEKPPTHLAAVNLFEGKDHYVSADGRITASYKKDEKKHVTIFSFMVNGKLLWDSEMDDIATPEFYKADLDRNGLEDYIVISWGGGCGLAADESNVDILLAGKGGNFDAISYWGFDPGLEDFVDLNGDGKHEVIIETFYGGNRHNYFVYNIYEFQKGRLVNADKKFSGFPKFVWYSNKNNDKDTTRLTSAERRQFVKKMDAEIKHEVLSVA